MARHSVSTPVVSSRTFGEFSRYRLDVMRSRFGTLTYLVADAERLDPVTGGPAIIRQADSEAEAVSGLC